MSVFFIFLVTLFLSLTSSAQDTLYLTNSFDIGVSSSYVMYDNGNFEYFSHGHCIGLETKGIGTYHYAHRKLIFTFDSLKLPVSSSNCINLEPSDSITLFIYDALDSSQVNFYSVSDTTGYWLDINNNRIATRNLSFRVSWIFYDVLEVKPDNSCSAYEIYLTPRFDTINGGTLHILNKKKVGYKYVEVYKPKNRNKRKYKLVYLFQFKRD